MFLERLVEKWGRQCWQRFMSAKQLNLLTNARNVCVSEPADDWLEIRQPYVGDLSVCYENDGFSCRCTGTVARILQHLFNNTKQIHVKLLTEKEFIALKCSSCRSSNTGGWLGGWKRFWSQINNSKR